MKATSTSTIHADMPATAWRTMRMALKASSIFTALLLAALMMGGSAPAEAGQGFTVGLPLAGVKSTAGLSLAFDCTWPDGYGYVPIRVSVAAGAPASVDRRISLEISSYYFTERRPVIVNEEIALPAGATSASKVIPFPRCSIDLMLSLNTWVNGRYLKELSFDVRPFKSTFFVANTAPATLFVTNAKIDVSKFDFVNGANLSYNAATLSGSGQPAAIGPANVGAFASLPPADLFEGWINYTALDVIFMARSELENLASTRPKVVEALRDWTRAGGSLCIHEVGKDWQGLAALEQCLQLNVPSEDAAKPLRGWSAADPAQHVGHLQQAGGAIVVTEDFDEELGGADAIRRNKRKKKVPKAPFVWRDAGLGTVIAMHAANPFPGNSGEWQWLFNTIGPSRWQWEMRHGISMYDGNSNFDDYSIADVGLPPVMAYRVLITLFVVGIGPLNYWLLRRKGRLHLLLFTVPVAAIVVSLSLVAYAVIADGFGAYLRARSFTQLDQQRAEAVTWARLSYYAGVAPSDGLQFSQHTALYPVFRDSNYNGSVQAARTLEWTPQQHLVRGWVPSRTPTQYESVNPHASDRMLRIAEVAEPPSCTVENRLGPNIEFLMLRSAAGDLFFGREIAADGRAALELLDTDAKMEEAAIKMINRRNANEPSEMAVVATSAAQLLFGSARRNMRMGNSYVVNGIGLLDSELSLAFEEVGASAGSSDLRRHRGPASRRRSGHERTRRTAKPARDSRNLVTGMIAHLPAAFATVSDGPLIELVKLHRYFGRTKAVYDVNFTVGRGQVFGYIGPNGAGKTTSMRILATLDMPTHGDAFVDGFSVVQDADRVRRRLGFMPDYFDTQPNIVVGEYLDFFARAYGLMGAERQRALQRVMSFTKLDGLTEKPIDGLSKGMKQRLCLGLRHDSRSAGDDPGRTGRRSRSAPASSCAR